MISQALFLHGTLGLKQTTKRLLFRIIQISATRIASYSTVDNEEVRKFTNAANYWWSHDSLLLLLNSIRVPFIRDGILSSSKQIGQEPSYPLKGYKIIDVGCGGGLLSEPLARLGASVTGLDPGLENIEVAIDHASKDVEIKERLTYICDTVENIAVRSPGVYDVVVCSEVIEHVTDIQLFIQHCVEITKDNGSLFFTTINRTFLSYLLGIIAAENILRVIPRGTHDWNKFVKPKELSDFLKSFNCRIVSKEGYMYNPIEKKFTWSGRNDSFYALHAQKL